jgi:hypothetical protein
LFADQFGHFPGPAAFERKDPAAVEGHVWIIAAPRGLCPERGLGGAGSTSSATWSFTTKNGR